MSLRKLLLTAFLCAFSVPAYADIYTLDQLTTSAPQTTGGEVNSFQASYNDVTYDYSYSSTFTKPADHSRTINGGFYELHLDGPNQNNRAMVYLDFEGGDIYVYRRSTNTIYLPDSNDHIETFTDVLSVVDNGNEVSFSFDINVENVSNYDSSSDWTGLAFGESNIHQFVYVHYDQIESTNFADPSTNYLTVFEVDRSPFSYTQDHVRAYADVQKVSEPMGFAFLGLGGILLLIRRRRQS